MYPHKQTICHVCVHVLHVCLAVVCIAFVIIIVIVIVITIFHLVDNHRVCVVFSDVIVCGDSLTCYITALHTYVSTCVVSMCVCARLCVCGSGNAFSYAPTKASITMSLVCVVSPCCLCVLAAALKKALRSSISASPSHQKHITKAKTKPKGMRATNMGHFGAQSFKVPGG
jgi:hypothetical protein